MWVKEDILAAIVIINNENVNKEGGSPFVTPRRDEGGYSSFWFNPGPTSQGTPRKALPLWGRTLLWGLTTGCS